MNKLSSAYQWVVGQTWDAINAIESTWRQTSSKIYRISIVTGDKRGAGTDANIFLIIYDNSGNPSKILRPQHIFKDDNERGATTHLDVGCEIGIAAPFQSIEIWRDNFGKFSLGSYLNSILFGGKTKDSSDWFLDRVEIKALCNTEPENNKTDDNNPQEDQAILSWVFPVHRWIETDVRYLIHLYDSYLPHKDSRSEFRKNELIQKKLTYVLKQKIEGGPVQIANLPSDENFSSKFFWTFVEKKATLIASTKYIHWTTGPWESLDSFKGIFKLGLGLPKAAEFWQEDWWFGLQRLQGVDPTHIKLCKELPKNLDLDPVAISPLLPENQTLGDLIKQKKIFICDLAILEGLNCKGGKEVAAPIALFYLNTTSELMPIAIQLRQQPGFNNPVYTPLDPQNTWLVAKMFYNNAEAQYHQSLTHLGFTHLMMEGVCASVHRCLSPSHPLFRLMAPHFLYLMAINMRGEEKLINPGGWVDSTMTQAVDGMIELMKRGFSKWHFSKLNPELELEQRGVLDTNILPAYPYRDDLLSVYQVIRKYVSKILSHYYEDVDSLTSDFELQEWRRELVAVPQTGLGFEGIPGSNQEGFTNMEEVIEVVTGILATCSLGHAASNSQQYDQYAFIPNYPGMLNSDPPTSKDGFSECDIVELLPSKEICLDIMVITKLLSTPITNVLGDFEVQYLFHPNDVQAAVRFREELKSVAADIEQRNTKRKLAYNDLNPNLIPNSISI